MSIAPMRTMGTALGLLLGLVTTMACAEHYGAPLTMKNPISLEAAVKQLDGQLDGQPAGKSAANVLVESKVDKVCEAKGCWLGLKSASGELHVTFKDYAFFVPPSLIGKTVRVEGKLEKVTMTLEETKHYVKDAGGDPSTVTEPRVHYELVASGVEVKT